MTDIVLNQLKEIIDLNKPVAFLIGAGISIPAPSNQLSGGEFTYQIIEKISPTNDIKEELIHLSNSERAHRRNKGDFLRFEGIMKVIYDCIDKKLNILSVLGLCDSPNEFHHSLAELLLNGHIVFTTNFDLLIERALEAREVPHKILFREEHFNHFLKNNSSNTLFKLHGSMGTIENGKVSDTRDSVQATLDSVGTINSEGLWKSSKRDVLVQILKTHDLLVLGYSGYDDFDICSTIKSIKSDKKIIWINHDRKESKYFDWQQLRESAEKDINGNYLKKREEFLIEITNQENSARKKESVHLLNIDTSHVFEYLNKETEYNPKEIRLDENWVFDKTNYFDKWQTEFLSSEGMQYFICATLVYSLGRIDSSLKYYTGALNSYKKEKNNHGQAQSLHNIGVLQLKKGMHSKALMSYRRSERLKEKYGNRLGISEALHSIGIVYQRKNRLDKALKNYKKSLSIRKEHDDDYGVAQSLHQIGRVYEIKGDLEKSLEYFEESRALELKLGNKDGLSVSLRTIGSIYRRLGKFNIAMKYIKHSLSLSEDLGYLSGIASNKYEMGRIFHLQKKYKKALTLYKQSQVLDKQLGDVESCGITEMYMGKIYLSKNKIKKANQWISSAHNKFQSIGSPYIKQTSVIIGKISNNDIN